MRPLSTTVRTELRFEAARPLGAGLVVALARRPGVQVRSEALAVTGSTGAVPVREVQLPDGGRLHEFTAPAGATTVVYRATATTDPAAVDDGLRASERWEFTRPSRFCPSDRLTRTAAAEFGRVPRADLPRAVAAWVGARTGYVSGSSLPTDGALETLLDRRGVCRDFAHLTAALLRALDVPARVAAAYAPGLPTDDFHAVVEAAPQGRWEVVDATGLAPRPALLRIAAGRDAADTAFLTTTGEVALTHLSVRAVTDGVLPADDHLGAVVLA
ncbi:transglutaminase-like domain-containing protein [Kineococcus sp. SYSU DK001]|uniref:transglutaminase-like domain-containing protein n=1 Tax=Kineococcus sp. SYSU DK001 TaxID=3383122 RepID=UPI003D7C560B